MVGTSIVANHEPAATAGAANANANEAPVVNDQTFSVAENSGNGTVVGTVSASDGDVTPTTFQDWAISGGTGQTAFAIHPTSAEELVTMKTADQAEDARKEVDTGLEWQEAS